MTSPRNRIQELRIVKASELRANPRNWRRHPEHQKTALRTMLERVGYVGAVIARETEDGLELVDGHLRASLDEDAEIPVVIVDLTESETAEVLATYDPISTMAEADMQALQDVIDTIDKSNAEFRSVLDLTSTESLRFAKEAPPPPLTEEDIDKAAQDLTERYSTQSQKSFTATCPGCNYPFEYIPPVKQGRGGTG